MMISVICVFNDKNAVESNLLPSLQKQTFQDYELVLIDSVKKGFKSASESLNYGGGEAKGDVFIFIHQDVVFESATVLEDIFNYSSTFEFGIAGVAGVGTDKDSYSKICHGANKTKVSKNSQFISPVEAVNLDECLLIIPKKIFQENMFSNLGPTWHLYGADYCLKMLQQNKDVLVLPIELWHLSNGKSLNQNYFDAIKELAKKYKNYDYIYTLFGKWPTNEYKLYIKCFYRKLRLRVIGR